MTSFNKWRSIPLSTNLEKIIKANTFERKLLALAHKSLSSSFSPLKVTRFLYWY